MRTTDVFAQVDMKIMYYELIKMLIEYERNKQPEVKDKTCLKLEIKVLPVVKRHRNEYQFNLSIYCLNFRYLGVGRKQECWQDRRLPGGSSDVYFCFRRFCCCCQTRWRLYNCKIVTKCSGVDKQTAALPEPAFHAGW